ncbi:Hypothetical predicted protein [Pelobates cultripes]|uniref:Uncharacterized protein n=1 Tax=Pelobates cultripes TaxID=61616 RepID=A0AAD1SHC3_PELCU|nr:Hypothetical predicted protein [Pelobates cultripes]
MESADCVSDSNMAPTASQPDSSLSNPAPSDGSSYTANPDIKEMLQNLPSQRYLASMLNKLASSFQMKLVSLGSDMRHIGHRVRDLEDNRDLINTQIQHLSSVIEQQTSYLVSMMRSLDDVDYRGRRNNLKVQSLPDTSSTNLPAMLYKLFNLILGKAPEVPVNLDRAHRLLRPRSSNSEAP